MQYEPSLRLLGIGARGLDCLGVSPPCERVVATTLCINRIEGEAGQRAKVAVALEPDEPTFGALGEDAAAREGTTEVRVAWRDILLDESCPAADGAGRILTIIFGDGRGVRRVCLGNL